MGLRQKTHESATTHALVSFVTRREFLDLKYVSRTFKIDIDKMCYKLSFHEKHWLNQASEKHW